MQTFIPSADIPTCVTCLDYRRLGKQRVEASQILKALADPTYGWQNHPAVTMWRGHAPALRHYYNHCVREWVARGYKNTMPLFPPSVTSSTMPPWWGSAIHASHRAALLYKDPTFYSRYGWTEQPALSYIWPKGAIA